jgi:phenylpyruvate tautomerase PptA (4-oxalocrotonate tautomerase family)
MPLLKIQTNVSLDDSQQQQLLTSASQQVAEALGKPERYVMVMIAPAAPMLFAGEDSPLAYLELKSIGLPESQTADLSAMLCQLMNGYGIPPDRVYIEFADAPRKMWGWNGGTF